jgi:hypothetical protein
MMATSILIFFKELQGISAYLHSKTPSLHLPLVVLISFLGYRLVAESLLPIDSESFEKRKYFFSNLI